MRNHDLLRSSFLDENDSKLLHPCETRFATNVILLDRLNDSKENVVLALASRKVSTQCLLTYFWKGLAGIASGICVMQCLSFFLNSKVFKSLLAKVSLPLLRLLFRLTSFMRI